MRRVCMLYAFSVFVAAAVSSCIHEGLGHAPPQARVSPVSSTLSRPVEEPSVQAPAEQQLPEGHVLDTDVPYGVASDRQSLDILYPMHSPELRPAILMFHGGGWYTGGKGGPRTLAMMCAFAEAGYVALSVGYRLSDEAPFPAAVVDCKRAVRWLREHADQYRVDPAHLAAMGASAGGHLAAMLAVTGEEQEFDDGGYAGKSSAVQAAVLVCAPLDLTVPLFRNPPGGADPAVARFLGVSPAGHTEVARRASPLSYVRRDLPPLLLIHGTADERVASSQSEKMAQALQAVGAPHELILVQGGGHGMGIAREPEVFRQILAFLAEHLAAGHPREGQAP